MAEHGFAVETSWTGNTGSGTSGYRDYARTVVLSSEGKPDLAASADPAFRGEADKWNPEELLIAALSECHLLSYLHAAVTRGVIVVGYADSATGTLLQEGNGGRMSEVTLRPRVTVADADMVEAATIAHEDAHEWCFIANSVNFPVRFEPTIEVAGAALA